MIETFIRQIKLLLIFLLDILHRSQKFVKFLWCGKHEIERICESQIDIYEKTLKVDQWLERSNNKEIRAYFKQYFGDDSKCSTLRKTIDRILASYKERVTKPSSDNNNIDPFRNIEDLDVALCATLRELTNKLDKTIRVSKGLRMSSNNPDDYLKDVLYRIVSYRMSVVLGQQMASTKYDSSLDVHVYKLMSFWNHLVRADQQPLMSQSSSLIDSKVFPNKLSTEISDRNKVISSRWSHVGFQGEDPGTDFRGMGLLGLIQLEYLARKPKQLARDLLQRSLNERHSYPFAIVGINLSYNLLDLFKDGSLKHLYYDTGDKIFSNSQRTLNLIKTMNDLYVELFLRFDCFWHESKPESIFEFKSLMERFVSVIRIDLSSRNFSLKFIY